MLQEVAVLFTKSVLQEGFCTIHKACVAKMLLYYSQSLCCKKVPVLFTKSVLQEGLLYYSRRLCCKKVAVLFTKPLLQEGLLY